MQLSPDFRDFLSKVNAEGVDYLLVGAYAMGAHGMPRYTGDIDLFYRPTKENVQRLITAVNDFGFHLSDFTVETLMQPEIVYQLGHPPYRIDLLNDISGVTYDEAWADHVSILLDGVPVNVLSLEHLALNKKASARDKDFLDLKLINKQLQSED